MNRTPYRHRSLVFDPSKLDDPHLLRDIVEHLDHIHHHLERQDASIQSMRERHARLARAFRLIPAIRDFLEELGEREDAKDDLAPNPQ